MRLIASAIVMGALLSGCAFDHRKDFAYSLLFKSDGFENDKAFSAAVAARFPPGTPVSELRSFAAAAQGECWSKDPDGFVCEFATRGQYCTARLVRITATVEAGIIKSTGFMSGGLGC